MPRLSTFGVTWAVPESRLVMETETHAAPRLTVTVLRSVYAYGLNNAGQVDASLEAIAADEKSAKLQRMRSRNMSWRASNALQMKRRLQWESTMRWFGPGQEEAWGQLCSEIGGEFIQNGWWKGSMVRLHVEPWTIVLDRHTVSDGESSTTYTRIRAAFLNPAGFRFELYRKGPLSVLARMLGRQDIEVGDPEFDAAFIIKSNDEITVRELFACPTIRQKIQALPHVRLEIKDNEGWFGTRFPDETDELLFLAHGVIRDVVLLASLFGLFTDLLEQLCQIRATTRQHPGVSL